MNKELCKYLVEYFKLGQENYYESDLLSGSNITLSRAVVLAYGSKYEVVDDCWRLFMNLPTRKGSQEILEHAQAVELLFV